MLQVKPLGSRLVIGIRLSSYHRAKGQHPLPPSPPDPHSRGKGHNNLLGDLVTVQETGSPTRQLLCHSTMLMTSQKQQKPTPSSQFTLRRKSAFNVVCSPPSVTVLVLAAMGATMMARYPSVLTCATNESKCQNQKVLTFLNSCTYFSMRSGERQ